jgi:hypothetical protein
MQRVLLARPNVHTADTLACFPPLGILCVEATRFGMRNLGRRLSWYYLGTLVGQFATARRSGRPR